MLDGSSNVTFPKRPGGGHSTVTYLLQLAAGKFTQGSSIRFQVSKLLFFSDDTFLIKCFAKLSMHCGPDLFKCIQFFVSYLQHIIANVPDTTTDATIRAKSILLQSILVKLVEHGCKRLIFIITYNYRYNLAPGLMFQINQMIRRVLCGKTQVGIQKCLSFKLSLNDRNITVLL